MPAPPPARFFPFFFLFFCINCLFFLFFYLCYIVSIFLFMKSDYSITTIFLFLLLLNPFKSTAQVHGEIHVMTDDYSDVSAAKVFLKNHADSAYSFIGLTDQFGMVEFSNYQIGIAERFDDHNSSIAVYPNPAAEHHFYFHNGKPGADDLLMEIFDAFGHKVFSQKAEPQAMDIMHLCWKPLNAPDGIYFCRIGSSCRKFLHLNDASRMHNTTAPELKSFDRSTDVFNAYTRFFPGQSNVQFDSTAADCTFQEGFNSASIIVQPVNYLHFYNFQTSPQAHVLADGAGHVFFDGVADSAGLAISDSAYLQQNIDLNISIESPGKIPIDTSFTAEWNGQTILLPLQDSLNIININVITDSVLLDIVLNGDTIANDTAFKADAPHCQIQLDYLTSPYDSVCIIQSKPDMNAVPDTSFFPVNQGITDIDLDELDYKNDEVWSNLDRHSYNNPGNVDALSHYLIRFEGINVNYTDSMNVT